MFESLLTGRDISSQIDDPPDSKFRVAFQETVVQDASLSLKLTTHLKKGNVREKYLVICGHKDMAFGTGIPGQIKELCPDISIATACSLEG